MSKFEEFPKMARWSRDVVITEKIDGTNAQIDISAANAVDLAQRADGWSFDRMGIVAFVGDYVVRAGSRSRWITPTDDNFGFAAWVNQNRDELVSGLGVGRHFGEWWGAGIQRRYGVSDKRFSLFNVGRWYDSTDCDGEDIEGRAAIPACCRVVPILAKGPNEPGVIEACIDLLRQRGSYAAPGFMDPEGVVLFHIAAGIGFKKTIKKDEMPKTLAAKQVEAV